MRLENVGNEAAAKQPAALCRKQQRGKKRIQNF
jgi:hypothetical protein